MDVMQLLARKLQPRLLAITAALLLGACATTTPAPPAPGYDALFAEATHLAEAGRTDAALDGYHRAAAADPSRKEPWQRIALINFAAGRPVAALMAAEETLQRDPSDTGASEVFIASGMQVARRVMQLQVAGAKHGDADVERARELVAKLVQVFGADAVIPDETKARYARRAVQQYRAAQARQLKSKKIRAADDTAKPRPDPLEVLGGD